MARRVRHSPVRLVSAPARSPSTNEMVVKIIGWVYLVFGIIAVVFGAFFLLLGRTIFTMMGSTIPPIPIGMMGTIGFGVGLIALIWGIFQIFVSKRFLAHENWARIVILVFAAFSLFSFPFGTAWAIFVGWALLFNKEVVRMFH